MYRRHIVNGVAWIYKYDIMGKQTGACRFKDIRLLGLRPIEIVFLALVGFVPPGF